MNSQDRRKFIRKCEQKMKKKIRLSAQELLTYSNIFCKRNVDPWMDQPFTPEELEVLDNPGEGEVW